MHEKCVCEGRKPVPNPPPAKQPEKSQANMTDIADKTCLLPKGSIFHQQTIKQIEQIITKKIKQVIYKKKEKYKHS